MKYWLRGEIGFYTQQNCFSFIRINGRQHDSHCEQNICESRMNVIWLFTICMQCEICEWQFSPFFMISSEKFANYSVIYCEITWIWCELEFTTENRIEMWFREMLNIAFKFEFSVNMNSHTFFRSVLSPLMTKRTCNLPMKPLTF